MDFRTSYNNRPFTLMEGALGERLKREYNLSFDDDVAMANLIYSDKGRDALAQSWTDYMDIANKYSLPFMATTPTRRANVERVSRSRYNEDIIGDNVSFLKKLKSNNEADMYIGGLMGCKGDAYKATEVLSIEEALEFHSWQAHLFKEVGADYLFAGIMPALTEAIGMAKAMEQTGLPYIISFMIRQDGCLIDGTAIHDAIDSIDRFTQQKPLCYMTNCVHPSILYKALKQPFNQTQLVRERFCGIQANTSPWPPEELDQSVDLICSDSTELAVAIMKLKDTMTLKIAGGCCGTDNSHLKAIAERV